MARAIKRLYGIKGIAGTGPKQDGATVALIAKETGKSERTVKRLRTIADLIPELSTMLEAIAAADGGVSRETVRRTLETVLSNDKTEPPVPATTTGKDGKQYPTQKPRKQKTVYIPPGVIGFFVGWCWVVSAYSAYIAYRFQNLFLVAIFFSRGWLWQTSGKS